MKKTFTVILCCSTLALMSFLIDKNAPPDYKNLKVLPKDITHEQMDSVMHHFTASLGKKCNFCHVFNEDQKKMDFAADDKGPKKIAREMMEMTAKINKKFFDVKDSKHIDANLQVTCFTCHHGSEHPDTKPEMHMAPPAGPGGPPPAGDHPPVPPPGTDSTKHQ